ncbi:MAG: histidine kinase [Gammaproteobacteria bacterium]|nr:MAG: histidine kinase [Gammaproteobacteria bacterium]
MARLDRNHTTHHILVLGLVWTAIILFFAWWGAREAQQNTIRLASAQARASFGKDQALRQWATRHGRIYVPVSDYFQPDPRMAKIPERDITTPSGLELTLINPVTITNQLDRDYGHLYGTSGKITSLTALSAQNMPDAWERSALKRINAGAKEVLEFVREGDAEFLRLMQPLIVTQGCLLCHFGEGFEIGKPGGGIAISLPMASLRAQEQQAVHSKFVTLFILWVFGMIGLAITAWLLHRQAQVRNRALVELRRSEERKSAILGSSLDCIVTIDADDRIIEFNPAAETTFGFKASQVIGKPMAELLVPESLREQHREGLRRNVETGLSTILGTRIETTALRSDGTEFPVELAITRIRQEDRLLFTAFLRDITERRKLEERLQKQASEDDLTGLLNRHTFEAALKRALIDDRQFHHCLMYLDLDRFKVVNDTSGHGAGDELLKQLADLLRSTVGERGILGRLGGDEFGLILQDCSLDGGQEVARELLEAVSNFRFYWEEKIFTLGMSIGVVSIDDHRSEASRLLSMADAACYRAKEEGRNRYYIYSSADQVLSHRKTELSWINRIESAFEEERFLLYQQPILPLQNGEENNGFFEVLLRMRDEEQQLVTPDKFLPAAERYNLMPTIDRWVVRHTLGWLCANLDYQGIVSINLSGASLTDTLFLTFLLDELETCAIPEGRICFEITETEAITNLSRARGFITELSEAGCHFALDDFGSGMSSYGYLKDLPVDFLKIDGRFVRNMDIDPVSLAMVRSIHEIGHLMGKRTIAEFVGHAAVLKTLQEIGVNFAQGFYLGEPAPLETLSRKAKSEDRARQATR